MLSLTNLFRSGRVRFAAAFAISCIVLYALINILPDSFIQPFNENTARALGLVLNTFGIPVTTAGSTVTGSGLAFRIVPECTPIFTAGLFLCFAAFYPATLREKAAGIIMGIPLLYLGNLARLAATFAISRYDRQLFDLTHVYLGQVFSTLLVILACLAWLRWMDHGELAQSIPLQAAGFLARFALISGALFLVWMKLQFGYIWLIDRFMLSGFSLFDYRFSFERQTLFYYETFSIVTFTSLVLAVRSLPAVVKLKGLAAGLGLLFCIHLFHRTDNALLAYFNFSSVRDLDQTLLITGQYLIPVLLLLYLTSHRKQDCSARTCKEEHRESET